MDEDLPTLSREELIDEVRKLRQGIRAIGTARARSSAGTTPRCEAFFPRSRIRCRSYRSGPIHPRMCEVPAVARRTSARRATLLSAIRALTAWPVSSFGPSRRVDEVQCWWCGLTGARATLGGLHVDSSGEVCPALPVLFRTKSAPAGRPSGCRDRASGSNRPRWDSRCPSWPPGKSSRATNPGNFDSGG